MRIGMTGNSEFIQNGLIQKAQSEDNPFTHNHFIFLYKI